MTRSSTVKRKHVTSRTLTGTIRGLKRKRIEKSTHAHIPKLAGRSHSIPLSMQITKKHSLKLLPARAYAQSHTHGAQCRLPALHFPNRLPPSWLSRACHVRNTSLAAVSWQKAARTASHITRKLAGTTPWGGRARARSPRYDTHTLQRTSERGPSRFSSDGSAAARCARPVRRKRVCAVSPFSTSERAYRPLERARARADFSYASQARTAESSYVSKNAHRYTRRICKCSYICCKWVRACAWVLCVAIIDRNGQWDFREFLNDGDDVRQRWFVNDSWLVS